MHAVIKERRRRRREEREEGERRGGGGGKRMRGDEDENEIEDGKRDQGTGEGGIRRGGSPRSCSNAAQWN